MRSGKVFPAARFYGTDAAFHDRPVPELAAANWLASADFLQKTYPDAVLLDIGSTTADIIPLSRFSSLIGLSDLARLRKGYLVYTGMLRTPVTTILSSVNLDGIPTPVSTEYFATSADAHLVLWPYHGKRLQVRNSGPQGKDPQCLPAPTRPGGLRRC